MFRYGENHPNTKLTNEQAREIKRIYAEGGITHKQLAAQFGVSMSCVWRIVNGYAWNHLEDEK